MANHLLVAVFFCVFIARSCAQNCNPYDTTSHQCNSQRSPTYRVMHSELVDASRQEHMQDYVVNTTLGLYQYLHPCMTTQEAALRLFYDQTTVPDQSSNWWSEMAGVIGAHGSPLVGRRKRAAHYGSEVELLNALLDQVRTETGTGHPQSAECIQVLIDEFKGAAASTFKAHFDGNFYVPTTHAPVHTTHPTTTTTTTTTTTRPTTATTTTTTTPAPVGATCTQCSYIDCLVSPSVRQCGSLLQEFCLTVAVFTSTGSQITRGCATRSECDSYHNPPDCSDVTNHQLPSGTTCRYCCKGDNCNKPPQLLPAFNSIYVPPSS